MQKTQKTMSFSYVMMQLSRQENEKKIPPRNHPSALILNSVPPSKRVVRQDPIAAAHTFWHPSFPTRCTNACQRPCHRGRQHGAVPCSTQHHLATTRVLTQPCFSSRSVATATPRSALPAFLQPVQQHC